MKKSGLEIHKEFKKGLRNKDPKVWLILGSILIVIALFAKLLLMAGLIIVGIVAYSIYSKKK